MYLERTIQKEIPNLCKNFKVIMLSGMRQVGKSTLFSHLKESERKHINLDDFDYLDLAENAPSAFFRQNPLPVFIDEIQRSPKLFQQIKAEVDKNEKYGQVWITGSQRFSLMQGVGESLAGRIFEVHLMPFSLYERQNLGLEQTPYLPRLDPETKLTPKNNEESWKVIWQGAWPRLIDKNPKEREQFFEAFISTFLERDIRTLSNVERLTSFRKFLVALASRTGQELRINKLSEIVGITDVTTKRWLSIAEAAGIIYFLPGFYSNLTKTLTKSPKLYMTDTGLAAYLCGFSSPDELASDTNAGAFFETFVVTEILKSYRHNAIEPKLFYYRDSKKQSEVDLLIHRDGKYYPVEIKMSSHPDIHMIKNFSELEKLGLKIGTGSVICMTENVKYLSDSVVAHSLWNL